MASLIGSIRNIVSDPWWFVKFAFFSYVVFVLLDQAYYNQSNPNYVAAYVLVSIIGLGCASVLMNRNINNVSPILPSLFSIFEIIGRAVPVSILTIPPAILYYMSVNWIYQNYEFEPFVSFIIYLLITLAFSPFIFIPSVLYNVNGKFSDAFNFKLFIDGAGNFIVSVASYILQYMIIFGIVVSILYILFLEMMGDHVCLLILKCVVIVFTFFSFYSYCSDLYMDVIPEIKEPQKKFKRTGF